MAGTCRIPASGALITASGGVATDHDKRCCCRNVAACRGARCPLYSVRRVQRTPADERPRERVLVRIFATPRYSVGWLFRRSSVCVTRDVSSAFVVKLQTASVQALTGGRLKPACHCYRHGWCCGQVLLAGWLHALWQCVHSVCASQLNICVDQRVLE